MNINIPPPPAREPFLVSNYTAPAWLDFFNKLVAAVKSNSTPSSPSYLTLSQSAAPAVSEGQGVIWLASTSGTLNGQAYSQGDVLFTGVVSGVQKTILMIDWSLY